MSDRHLRGRSPLHLALGLLMVIALLAGCTAVPAAAPAQTDAAAEATAAAAGEAAAVEFQMEMSPEAVAYYTRRTSAPTPHARQWNRCAPGLKS
jgi:hypothetical protein